MEESNEVEITHDGFIALDKHQKDVNVQHKKFRDQERLTGSIQAKYDSSQRELAEFKAKADTVVIPDAPDPYSDTYAADVVTRDEAVQRKAEIDARGKLAIENQDRTNEAKKVEAAKAQGERVATFDSNMVSSGFDPMEMTKAANAVADNGMSDHLEDFILSDPDGPAIVMYLNQNPIEQEKMRNMSGYELFSHLESNVRAEASLLKPQTSNAPSPPKTLNGGGVSELKDPLIAGAVFD